MVYKTRDICRSNSLEEWVEHVRMPKLRLRLAGSCRYGYWFFLCDILTQNLSYISSENKVHVRHLLLKCCTWWILKWIIRQARYQKFQRQRHLTKPRSHEAPSIAIHHDNDWRRKSHPSGFHARSPRNGTSSLSHRKKWNIRYHCSTVVETSKSANSARKLWIFIL
jgi:hypothetical protein